MHDPVADVLRQRAALGTGAGAGIAVSVVLHGGLIALAVYAAIHAKPPVPVSMLNIKLAQPSVEPRPLRPPSPVPPAAKADVAPPVPIPAPSVEPPKTPPTQPPEKNTVPLSPFGRSTKKGSESPAVEPPVATSTAPAVPIGGSGVTGLEGGDFPYTLYLEAMQRRIGSNWFRPQIAGGRSVIVYFRIQRDGTITDSEVKTSSENGTFDRQALSAVRSSSPLNPLPFAYNGTYLGVHLTFR